MLVGENQEDRSEQEPFCMLLQGRCDGSNTHTNTRINICNAKHIQNIHTSQCTQTSQVFLRKRTFYMPNVIIILNRKDR